MALIRREEPTLPPMDMPKTAQTHTILGSESAFEGKLTFQGAVRIDGKFKGEIYTADTLVVGERAEIDAEIHVGNIIVNGTVRGNIYAKEVIELQAPAKLYGDVETPSLIIQKGVIFQGGCRMENLGSSKKEKIRVVTKQDQPAMA